jgi:hypothetical protein
MHHRVAVSDDGSERRTARRMREVDIARRECDDVPAGRRGPLDHVGADEARRPQDDETAMELRHQTLPAG